MKDEIKEIKLEKRKPTFDYILNDLAFDSLMFRVVNGIGSSQDKFDFDYQIKLMQKEVEDLREDNYAYHQLMKIQNKREYRSKFLKEFQEEFGTNVFPDYDEIYKRYDKVKKENERLKNGYCELKEKCNNGECDCTNEEYESMVQANIKGSLLLDEYKQRNEKAIEYIKEYVPIINNNLFTKEHQLERYKEKEKYNEKFINELLNILGGDE